MTGTATPGATLVLALRRARGSVVSIGEAWLFGVSGERIGELVDTLLDPQVAVVGWTGLASSDMRHFEAAAPESGDPVAVAWAGLTFRTGDGLERGPIDEGFADPDMLAAWWSLVLRDTGDEAPSRAARALGASDDGAADTNQVGTRLDRATRRDRYRIIDRFGGRYDLLTDPVAADRSRALRR
jgi:hypothetical protein